MGRLRSFFNRIIAWCTRPRAGRPQDIPKKLDAKMLQKAMEEARFLRSREVDVKSLARGEKPMPRRADQPDA